MNGIGYGRYGGFSVGGSSSTGSAFRAYAYTQPPSSKQNYGGNANDISNLPSSQRQFNGFANDYSSLNTTVNGAKQEIRRRKPDYLTMEQPLLNRPLTKQVDQLLYEIPQNRNLKNKWSCPPEFIKVFTDLRIVEYGKAVFDCVLLGTPRPKVFWLFNEEKLLFDDVLLEDTADLCRITIKCVQPYHYGVYTVIAENEVGRAITTATLLPINYN